MLRGLIGVRPQENESIESDSAQNLLAAFDRCGQVIVDYEMPGMDGEVVARKVRSVNLQVPVVLYTAFSEAIPDRVRPCVDGIATKPDFSELLQRPARLLKTLHRYGRRVITEGGSGPMCLLSTGVRSETVAYRRDRQSEHPHIE